MGYFLIFQGLLTSLWHDGVIYYLRQNSISGYIINIFQDFLCSRKQKIVSNGQCSSCADIIVGVRQWSILGPLLFLIYFTDLSDDLKSECKLVTDDTFFIVHSINTSARDLNEDLEKIGNRAFNWKMNFNPDPNKQAQYIIFNESFYQCLELIQYNAR